MNEIQISDNKELLDISFVFEFLNKEANWCKGISLEKVKKSIENSLCVGVYVNEKQIGFGRAITDYATFANIVDIFVIHEYRRRGIGKAIVEYLLAHHGLQGLRRITLATSKQEFYGKIGFKQLKSSEKFMEIYNPDIYNQHP